MKSLKFDSNLIPKILSDEKTTTWRFWDDKSLKAGDEVNFTDINGGVFAKAKLTEVKEKSLQEVDTNDWSGHEEFPCEEEMYKTYSKYYSRKVTPDTQVKIIHFELM